MATDYLQVSIALETIELAEAIVEKYKNVALPKNKQKLFGDTELYVVRQSGAAGAATAKQDKDTVMTGYKMAESAQARDFKINNETGEIMLYYTNVHCN